MSTLLNPREPIITNAAGLDKRNFDFEFGPETQVYYGCSLTWKNELFIVGGGSELRQISKVEKCSLKRIGSLQQTNGLPLFSQTGSCVNINDEKVYLCFVVNNSPECFIAASPTDRYNLVSAQSHFDHSTTRITASQGNINYKSNFDLNFGEINNSNSDEILAVGSCWDENQHKKAEILSINSHTWLEIDDYNLDLWYQYSFSFFYKIKFIPLLSQWLQL